MSVPRSEAPKTYAATAKTPIRAGIVSQASSRRLGRRELAWLTTPALIGVFAVAAYVFGASLRGTDILVNEVALVRGAPGTDAGQGQVYLGVFSPGRGTYQLEIPGGALLTAPMSQEMGGMPGAGSLDVLQGDPARVRDLAVGFSSIRTIRADTPLPAPNLAIDLRLEDRHLKGTVTNHSSSTVEGVAVVLGASVAKLGDLGPGASATVDVEARSDPLGQSLSDKLIGQVFFGDPARSADATSRAMTRRAIIDQLSFDPNFGPTGTLNADGPMVLGWGSNDPLAVNVEGRERIIRTPAEDHRAVRVERARRSEVRVERELVDDRAPGHGSARRVGRASGIAEEDLADELVRERLAQGVAPGLDVDRRACARPKVAELGHAGSEHDRDALDGARRMVRDGALEVAVLEPEVDREVRGRERRVRSDGADRAEPDGEIADPGGIALEDVERTRPRHAAHLLRHRGGQEGATRDLELIGAPAGREDAQVDLALAGVRARGAPHERDLVDQDVGPAERGSEDIRRHRDDADQGGHRQPGEFAPPEAAQDEVVDRADQHDVGHQEGEQPADRGERRCRQRRDGIDELAVVGAAGEDRRAGTGREDAPPDRGVGLRVGDPGGRRVEAQDGHRSVPERQLGGHDTVADGGQGPTRPGGSPERGQVRGGRRQLAQQRPEGAGGHVDRRARPKGQELVGEGRQEARTAGTADDDQAAPASDPTAERTELCRAEVARVDVLPDQPVDRAERLDPLREGLDRQRDDRRWDGVRGRQDAEVADDPIRALGHDADEELRGIGRDECDLARGDRLARRDDRDFEMIAKGRRLGIQGVPLPTAGRQVDGGPEPGLALDAARQAELPAHGLAGILEVDLDGHPGAQSGVPVEQGPGGHRERIGRDRRAGAEPGRGDDERGEGRPEEGVDAGTKGTGEAGGTTTGHRDPHDRLTTGLSQDVGDLPEVAPRPTSA